MKKYKCYKELKGIYKVILIFKLTIRFQIYNFNYNEFK